MKHVNVKYSNDMAITVNGADHGMYEIRWIEISSHSTLHAQNKYEFFSSQPCLALSE